MWEKRLSETSDQHAFSRLSVHKCPITTKIYIEMRKCSNERVANSQVLTIQRSTVAWSYMFILIVNSDII